MGVGWRLPRSEARSIVNRRYLLTLVCLGVLVLAPTGRAAPLTATEDAILDELNRVRSVHGLTPLRVDVRLQRAARSHSADMLRRGYFAHGAFSRRLQLVGARGPRLAENIAWAQGARTNPRRIVAMWLASPPHRANVLRGGFRRVGLGTRRGTFAGRRGALVVTANFAGR